MGDATDLFALGATRVAVGRKHQEPCLRKSLRIAGFSEIPIEPSATMNIDDCRHWRLHGGGSFVPFGFITNMEGKPLVVRRIDPGGLPNILYAVVGMWLRRSIATNVAALQIIQGCDRDGRRYPFVVSQREAVKCRLRPFTPFSVNRACVAISSV